MILLNNHSLTTALEICDVNRKSNPKLQLTNKYECNKVEYNGILWFTIFKMHRKRIVGMLLTGNTLGGKDRCTENKGTFCSVYCWLAYGY